MRQLALSLTMGLAGAALLAAQSESPLVLEQGYWTRTVQGSINLAGADRLRVETSSGSVSAHGGSDSQAGYVLKLRVKAANAREAEVLLRDVYVKTGSEGGWTSLRVTPPRQVSSAELSVNAPRTLRNVWMETAGGDIDAVGFDGGLEARSGGGHIAADGIRGQAELRTAGGDIQVGMVGGPLKATSGGGGIRVDKAGAGAWLETGGGEIYVRQAAGAVRAATGGGNIRIERAGSTVLARTAGGLIQVQQAAGLVTAENSGGAIQVDSASGVRCESAAGAIRLRNVAGAVRASANSGSILAQLASSQPMNESLLSTNAGDITVFIPSNLALTIQATNESGGMGRIISDFAQVHAQAGVAEGALNGGGPILRINAMGGTIYLRREK